MRISEVFAMGGGYGQRNASYYSGGCGGSSCDFSSGKVTEPRYTRRGLAHILGSPADGGGLLGILGGSPCCR